MKPIARTVFKAPAKLYDHDLGWLLGKRFLCLTHFGRKSGRRYRTVLEVIGLRPGTREVLAIAGLGPSSDWFRNIQAAPRRRSRSAAESSSPRTASSTNPKQSTRSPTTNGGTCCCGRFCVPC